MRLHRLISAALATFLAPRVAVACTPAPGVDVAAFVAALERPAYAPWAVSAASVGLWVLLGRRGGRGRRWTVALIGLAALQPAWWVPGTLGDCGRLRDLLAATVAAASVLLVSIALLHARHTADRFREAGV